MPRFVIAFATMLSLVFIVPGLCVDPERPTYMDKAIDVEPIKAVDHVGERRYALVVGINDYRDGQIPDLALCEADATAIHKLVTDPEKGGVGSDQAALLIGKDATYRNIRKALSDLRKIPADSTVFVYFSGHGAKEGDEAFWVTQDAELNDLVATAMPDSEVQRLLSHIPSQRVIVIIDACYAAATVKGGKALANEFEPILQRFTGKGRAFLMAAGSGQEAIEAQDLRHSVFTHYVIKGLAGESDVDGDGVITLTEVATYIDTHVADEARVRGGVQRPIVLMEQVQEPSKFRLTIDADRLRRNLRDTAQAKALRAKRLAALETLYLEEKLTRDHSRLGLRLIKEDASKLDPFDRKRLSYFIRVADGQFAPEKLQRALDLIETPQQRQSRLEREAAKRAQAQLQQKIAELLAYAKARDNKDQGREAIKALDELLQLAPEHSQAKALRKKIAGYIHKLGDKVTNSLGMKLVYLPPGRFEMGGRLPSREVVRKYYDKEFRNRRSLYDTYKGEHPRHLVKLTRSFFMGAHEVTRGQFERFALATGHHVKWRSPGFSQTDNHPVVMVNMADAVAFCEWLSQKEGRAYRLPTEAEWEYACRAGTNGVFYWGNDHKGRKPYENWISGGPWLYKDKHAETAPVGSYKPNPWGLYDMLGNVSELCWSIGDYPDHEVTDPIDKHNFVAARGGAWNHESYACRSAIRGTWVVTGEIRKHNIGFRVVLDLD